MALAEDTIYFNFQHVLSAHQGVLPVAAIVNTEEDRCPIREHNRREVVRAIENKRGMIGLILLHAPLSTL